MNENALAASMFERLLSLTLLLEERIMESDSDPEHWVELLEDRQAIMDQISAVAGPDIPDGLKQEYVQKIREIDKRLIPVIRQKQEQMANKLAKLKQGKTMNKQYMGYSTPAYGAFFDKKK
jgi:flagellar protein FliT